MTPQYIAGLFDGEGSVSSTVNKKTGQIQVRASLAMSHEETVRKLYRIFGGYFGKQNKYAAHHKDKFHWYVTGKNLLFFLATVMPHLEVKREEAEIVLQIQTELSKRGKGSRQKLVQAAHRRKLVELRNRLSEVKGGAYAPLVA